MISYIINNIKNSYVGRLLSGTKLDDPITIADVYESAGVNCFKSYYKNINAWDEVLKWKRPESIVALAKSLDLSEDFIEILQGELSRVSIARQARLEQLKNEAGIPKFRERCIFRINNGK